MANKQTFDEGAFRVMLDDSLREVTVTDELRAKTLEKCRSWLESTGDGKSAIPESTEAVSSGGRILAFAGRHAARLRFAAGLAACLLVVVLIGQLLPKLGLGSSAPSIAAVASMEAAAEPSGAGLSSGIAAKSAELPEVAFSDSVAADTAGQSTVTDGAAMNETAGIDDPSTNDEASENNEAMLQNDSAARSGDASPAASASGEAGSTQEATASVAAAVPEESPVGTTAFLFGSSKPFSSLAADNQNSALPEKPARALVESVAKSLLDSYPTAVPDYAGMFAAYQAPVTLTPQEFVATESIRDLLVPTESAVGSTDGSSGESWSYAAGNTGFIGLWRLPAKTDDGMMLIPILQNLDAAGTGTLLLGDPAAIRDEGGWLKTLSDQNRLKEVLETVAGHPVADWVILDAGGGTGFLVGWQDGEKEMCMPFMDQPEKIGLENGRAYDWNALKTTVAPFL